MYALVDLENERRVVFWRSDGNLEEGVVRPSRINHMFALIVGFPFQRLDPVRVTDIATGNLHAEGFAFVLHTREGAYFDIYWHDFACRELLLAAVRLHRLIICRKRLI